MKEVNNVEFLGYHGTNSENENSIIKSSFKKSNLREDWFGDGCYFFTKGISSEHPSALAEKWAIDAAWDKETRVYKYDKYVVFETMVSAKDDEILDLTASQGLTLFNKFRDGILDKIRLEKKKLRKGDYADSDIFNELKQKIGITVIIGNVFIKFADLRKVFGLRSNVANVTMFCVDNTKNEYIETLKHEVIKKGEITL